MANDMKTAVRKSIRFLLNDDLVVLDQVRASETLLDFLRIGRRLTGSKEGCAEGDCGACTVLVGRLVDGAVRYETVNACIRFVGSLDATHVVTVEHLARPSGVLHPVQQALVEEHGSQCGFCTPGFVMSLYSLWLSTADPTPHQIEKALQGNLCRCTGYAPIVRAAEVMGRARPEAGNDRLTAMRERVRAELARLADGARVEIEHGGERVIVPASVDDLASVLEAEPKATIVSGSTDVGLWVTKQMRDIEPAVFISNLAELHRIEADATGVRFFACVSYSEAFAEIARRYPAMAAYWDRIGGDQVRNMGTIGGNIANGSPIGDTPPPLIALGAELTLRKGAARRTVALEEFFIAYGRQDREPGEFVESVFVPALPAEDKFAVYKITKRRDEDISALSAAFRVSLDANGIVTAARIAFGGMAATPKRAKTVEAALVGKPWTETTVEAARAGFDTDFAPLSDWRATAEYRMLTAKNLLTRFFLETGGEKVQVVRHEPALGRFETMDKRREIELKDAISGGVHVARQHDSAHKHVTGLADYIDDMPEPTGTLHATLGLSAKANADIVGMDLDAVKSAPGVVAVLTADDVPGVNDISPTGRHDEPVLADRRVEFHGQPIFAVVATTRLAARRAAALAKIDYRERQAVTDVVMAMEAGYPLVTDPLTLKRGDAAAGLAGAKHRIKGEMRIGGQDHFYLEGQIAMAVPGEDDEVTVWSSTQHPSEVQHMVAHALGTNSSAVTVQVRRMGGGFGGKETQANQFAAIAAIAAKKLNRAVKIRPDRDDDMVATGKRHDFHVAYDVGFDDEGRIQAVDATYAARCGFSSDLSGAVTDRALFHADNCYFFPHVRLASKPMKTNTVSNTAFRGFGGPQGMVGGERMIEEIAYALGKDPLDVRRANFYGEPGSGHDLTPYHQTVEDNIAARVVDELEASSNYQARRREIVDFNRSSRVIRRGIALTPVKFGISFTATWFNQAGALVHVYQDGSIHLNHGGTEMGQGLYTKVAQVLADEFQVDLETVRVTATSTGKVPNTSATAASSGSDLNGMAAANAAQQIKDRLVAFAAEKWSVPVDSIEFVPNHVRVGNHLCPFPDLIKAAYQARVQLSAAGFYKTPKIHWDREKGIGRPFYYFAYGAACSEVAIDTLTGEYQVERVDILHDVGHSLNPAIDRGQVEGGFVQGMGWLTTEELWWDREGRLRTHAPSTYKIPLASDRPKVFNVKLAEWSKNREATIRRSKAVGEPPFMLAISVLEALSMAVASVAEYRECPRLDAPATPERVLMAVERLKGLAPS